MDENSRSRDSLQILVNFSEMSYLLTYNTRHVKTFLCNLTIIVFLVEVKD